MIYTYRLPCFTYPSKLIELTPYIQMLQFQSRHTIDKRVFLTDFSALEKVIQPLFGYTALF